MKKSTITYGQNKTIKTCTIRKKIKEEPKLRKGATIETKNK